MKILVDHNLPPRLARALQELFKGQHEIVALRDKFQVNATDLEWINGLSADGRWIVISGDRGITRKRSEYHAFRNSRLIGFFLSRGLYKSSVVRQMERILALWGAIEALAESVEGGAMFELPIKSSRIRQLKE